AWHRCWFARRRIRPPRICRCIQVPVGLCCEVAAAPSTTSRRAPASTIGRARMIDSNRRTILTTGAAAAAASAAPQVFAQGAQPAAPQGWPAGTKVGFYEKGGVRIRYAEIGSGFPLLAAPGGGLNSRLAVWPNAVINIMEEFKNDFRVISMDQRNASGG